MGAKGYTSYQKSSTTGDHGHVSRKMDSSEPTYSPWVLHKALTSRRITFVCRICNILTLALILRKRCWPSMARTEFTELCSLDWCRFKDLQRVISSHSKPPTSSPAASARRLPSHSSHPSTFLIASYHDDTRATCQVHQSRINTRTIDAAIARVVVSLPYTKETFQDMKNANHAKCA